MLASFPWFSLFTLTSCLSVWIFSPIHLYIFIFYRDERPPTLRSGSGGSSPIPSNRWVPPSTITKDGVKGRDKNDQIFRRVRGCVKVLLFNWCVQENQQLCFEAIFFFILGNFARKSICAWFLICPAPKYLYSGRIVSDSLSSSSWKASVFIHY